MHRGCQSSPRSWPSACSTYSRRPTASALRYTRQAMTDPFAIRELFLPEFGRETYRRFVRAVNAACRRKGRLLLWQERLWSEFAHRHPEAHVSPDAILRVFRVCDVHGCE